MKGMNKAILIGEVSETPRLRTLPSGTAHLTIKVYTPEEFTDAEGVVRQRKAWHTVIAWGKYATALAPILTRGGHVSVEGRIVNRQWDDVSGRRHHVTEIYADDVTILDRKSDGDRRDAA